MLSCMLTHLVCLHIAENFMSLFGVAGASTLIEWQCDERVQRKQLDISAIFNIFDETRGRKGVFLLFFQKNIYGMKTPPHPFRDSSVLSRNLILLEKIGVGGRGGGRRRRGNVGCAN